MKYTFTFSGAGQYAPIFITVTGLTPSEMDINVHPTGIIVFEIRGLRIGGAVNPFNNDVGHLCFTRSEGASNIDQRRHEYYRQNVCLPFIEGCRRRFDLIEPGTEIPADCSSVGWMDGDWPQFKGVTEEKRI